VRGITPAELAWQSQPGTTRSACLLAHIAVVEVHWTLIAIEVLEPGGGRPAAQVRARRRRLAARAPGHTSRPPARQDRWRSTRALLRRARNIVKKEFARYRPADLARTSRARAPTVR
jgi:hypothetical protein